MDKVKAACSTPSSVSETPVLPSRPLIVPQAEEKKGKGGKDSYLRIINKKKVKKAPEQKEETRQSIQQSVQDFPPINVEEE